MLSPWATIRPVASKSAVEWSLRSLMFVEYDDFISAMYISSQMPASELRKSSVSIGV